MSRKFRHYRTLLENIKPHFEVFLLCSSFHSQFNIRPSFSEVSFWDVTQKCHAGEPE